MDIKLARRSGMGHDFFRRWESLQTCPMPFTGLYHEDPVDDQDRRGNRCVGPHSACIKCPPIRTVIAPLAGSLFAGRLHSLFDTASWGFPLGGDGAEDLDRLILVRHSHLILREDQQT